MSKSKSIFVTIIMAAMLGCILATTYRVNIRIFMALVVLLAVYGFLRGARDLCRWLEQTEERQTESVEAEPVDVFAHDDEFEGRGLFDGSFFRFREGKIRE